MMLIACLSQVLVRGFNDLVRNYSDDIYVKSVHLASHLRMYRYAGCNQVMPFLSRDSNFSSKYRRRDRSLRVDDGQIKQSVDDRQTAELVDKPQLLSGACQIKGQLQ